MEKRTFLKALAGTMLAAAIAPATFAEDAVKSGYAQVNGLKYYYEIIGKGEPLFGSSWRAWFYSRVWACIACIG